MKRKVLRALGLLGAFALLSGGDCDFGTLGDILDEPGSIRVTNVGTETAVVAISADDVKSYPTLAGGATGSAQTNVGGGYHVSVVMTPENTAAYHADLMSMRRLVEKQIDGSTSSAEKTALFLQLAGIKSAISSLEMTNAASCSGTIKLDADTTTTVNATVRWVPQDGAGFWDLTCGSN